MQEALLICHQASFISHLSVEDGSYIKWKSLETVDHMNINNNCRLLSTHYVPETVEARMIINIVITVIQ